MIYPGFPRHTGEPCADAGQREFSEDFLLARVAKRDREALAEVYARFQRPLFSYLFHLLGQKELAEDVLQAPWSSTA